MKGITDDLEVRHDTYLREEDLEAIDTMIYTPKRRELKARTIFDLKTDIPVSAETVSYDTLSEAGAAKVTANGADDIPLVDGDLTRKSHRIVTIESGFKLRKQEIRAAEDTGTPIESNKASTARRVVAERENSIVFKGDAEHDIDGAINVTGMLTYDVENNEAGTSTKWEDKTGLEIIKDIRKAKNKLNNIEGFVADTLALAPDLYDMLENPINEYDTRPIQEYINDADWFERIVSIQDLAEASPENAGQDVFMVIDSDPAHVQLAIALDITRHEPNKLPNGDYQINVEERTGGLIVRYPQALLRGEGA